MAKVIELNPRIVFAQATLATGTRDGLSFVMTAGDPWDSQDPFVLERPEFFGPFPPEHTIRRTVPPVGQTT